MLQGSLCAVCGWPRVIDRHCILLLGHQPRASLCRVHLPPTFDNHTGQRKIHHSRTKPRNLPKRIVDTDDGSMVHTGQSCKCTTSICKTIAVVSSCPEERLVC